MLPEVEALQSKLRAYTDAFDTKGSEKRSLGKGKESSYEGGSGGFWDDFALANFLEGVCWRYIAHPVLTNPSKTVLYPI